MSINHQRADAIEYNGELCTIKRKAVSVSSSGDNSVISGVTGKKLVVISGHLVSAGTVAVTLKSGTGGGAVSLSGAMPLVANGQIQMQYSPVGHFETAAGSALNISLGGAVAVTGLLTYIEVSV